MNYPPRRISLSVFLVVTTLIILGIVFGDIPNVMGSVFNTKGFTPRSFCGNWSTGHIRLHITSDILIGTAYVLISLIMIVVVAITIMRRRKISHPEIIISFSIFIFSCGVGHYVDSMMFWQPHYRLLGMVKFITAIASWSTAILLIPVVPKLLTLKTQSEIEDEITTRTQELVEVREGLETALTTKDTFLAIVSHELRTPLTPVVAVASALKQDPSLSVDHREMIDIMSDNLHLEMRLIDDLLDVMRVKQGKLSFRFEVVNAHTIIEEAIKSSAHSSNATIKVDLDAPNPIMHGDRNRLLQVFWNVIRNAIKFMPKGGILHIVTRNECDSKMSFVVSFKDAGVGIEPGMTEKIFNAFEQGEGTFIRRYGGLGLGLTISRSIVEAHGGVISAKSDGIDQGAEIIVELPAIKEVMDVNTTLTSNDQDIRLFFVEDDPETARIYIMLFRRSGFQVTHASTMAKAIELASSDFDIVLSDIALGDGSGWDVMKHIRKNFGDIPGIALSGFGSPEDIKRSNEAGFHTHLVKPTNTPALIEMLRRLARKP